MRKLRDNYSVQLTLTVGRLCSADRNLLTDAAVLNPDMPEGVHSYAWIEPDSGQIT